MIRSANKIQFIDFPHSMRGVTFPYRSPAQDVAGSTLIYHNRPGRASSALGTGYCFQLSGCGPPTSPAP